MNNIPDSVSFDDLKKLLEEDDDKPMYDGLNTRQLLELCEKTKRELYEKCSNPMVHKALALMIIQHFIDFHRDKAGRLMEQDCFEALLWAKDVGKLESARRLLADVSWGDGDFFYKWDFNEDPKAEDDS